MRPVAEQNRIESLDVMRGFSLLGILLVNIIGFGLLVGTYLNPSIDITGAFDKDMFAWASVWILGEGAMRTIFSILFGAGVILFTDPARGKTVGFHYKRTLILLMFGLINAYVFIWNGDILVTYACAGLILYWLRNWKPEWLLTLAAVGILLGALAMTSFSTELYTDRVAFQQGTIGVENSWSDYLSEYSPTATEITEEFEQRRTSYSSVFKWNAEINNFIYLNEFHFWILDAFNMMLIGMALYKFGVLQAKRSFSFNLKLMLGGFAIGLSAKGYYVMRCIESNFDILQVNPYMHWTYDLGRLGIAFGYMGVLLCLLQRRWLTALLNRFAEVGRMALTNYLMQSVICMLIFTGAGASLVGHFSRAELYPIVLAIWVFQIIFSHYWLRQYRYGPVEWLWRSLTYGKFPEIKRAAPEASK